MIDLSQIQSVYSGRLGKCCCGCSGKHSYPSRNADRGVELRGYALTAEDVSDRSVANVVRKIEALDYKDEGYAFVAETETRVYIAYKAR